MRDLWYFSFFDPGDVSPTHSELCRFVSGSQTKHQVSSPVIILLKKSLHRPSRCLGKMWLDLCSGVKECVTKRTHNFLFPKSFFRIRRTTILRMFKDSAIILYAIWRQFFTKSATAAIFTSFRVDFGRPTSSSSSTSFLPSRNREYHLKSSIGSDPHSHKPFAPILIFPLQIDRLWNKTLWSPWLIKKTDFTRQVITRTLSKINKRNSVCGRMFVSGLVGWPIDRSSSVI